MIIGFLGAGQMAQTLARRFHRAGHAVVLCNSRGPESLKTLLERLGPGAAACTVEDLADNADLIFLAVRWNQIEGAAKGLGPLAGKIVVDTTNNRVGPRPEDLVDLGGRTSSEVVAQFLPGARLVKAFNHQPIPALAEVGSAGGDDAEALFLSGDDPQAKQVVAGLIKALGGEPLDLGLLAEGGRLQSAGGPLAGHGRLLKVSEARALLEKLGHTNSTSEGHFS